MPWQVDKGFMFWDSNCNSNVGAIKLLCKQMQVSWPGILIAMPMLLRQCSCHGKQMQVSLLRILIAMAM